MAIRSLRSAEEINRAIESSPSKLVVIRFGSAGDPLCLCMDSLLDRVEHRLSRYVLIYTCELSDIGELVPAMGLDSPMNIMCFYNLRHIKIDCSTGDNNKIDFLIGSEKMLIDLLTLAYRAGVKNKGVAVSPLNSRELGGGRASD
jgi:U5 snRNP protein, DIM1 family